MDLLLLIRRATFRYAVNADVYRDYLAQLEGLRDSNNDLIIANAQEAFDTASSFTSVANVANLLSSAPGNLGMLGALGDSLSSELGNEFNTEGNNNIIDSLSSLQQAVNGLTNGNILPPQMDDTDVRTYTRESSQSNSSDKFISRVLADTKQCPNSDLPGSRW